MSDEERIDSPMGDEIDSDDDIEMDEEGSIDIKDLTPEQKAELAETKKLEGNNMYKEKSYKEALNLYTEAIELCPTCVAYYSNRAATYMMLGLYVKALEDARQSTIIQPSFTKGYLREGKCHLAMGEIVAAIRCYEKVLETEPKNTAAKNELNQAKTVQQHVATAYASFEKGDFRRVVFCMDRCIEISVECKRFKVFKAESLALIKRYQESQEIANDLLRSDGKDADAMYVRGLCLYYQDNVDKAFQHFQQVLRLAPDHSKARDIYKRAKALKQKKEEGNAAFRSGQLDLAYKLYTEALEIDPYNVFTNSKLYNNRATVCSKLSKLSEAIENCSKAIELDDTYMKAYMRRAKCYMDSEQYDEAVRDYERICKMEKTRENKQLLQNAKVELKKSKRKDYYKILGVPKTATEDEMKKAYRKRALLHHPDRHSNASEEKKKEEEKKFKEIGEAYAILSDPKKKARFDSGQDLDDPDYGDFDPNSIFQTFFGGGGGGGGGFSFNGGGGGHHFHQHQQGGFPGGFTFQFG